MEWEFVMKTLAQMKPIVKKHFEVKTFVLDASFAYPF